MSKRLTQLRARLAGRRLDGLLVSGRENQEYLTGFTAFRDSSRTVNCLGDVLITRTQAIIFPGRCEVLQLSDLTPAGFAVIAPGRGSLAEALRQAGVQRLGIETENISQHRFAQLQQGLGFLELVPASGLVEELRQIKDADELALIRQAVRIADQALAEALALARPGVTERALAIAIECSLRQQAAMATAFDPIISSGPRSAYIHPAASDRRVQPGELLLIDFGAGYEHYYSDLTRTVVIGEPTPEQAARYEVVREALRQATAAARPGTAASRLDAIARDVIRKAGYGDYLVHSVGHGVGRSVHEQPWLREGSETILQANMVITLEPGFYIPGWGGLRLEDVILVTPAGPEVLTHAPKNLAL